MQQQQIVNLLKTLGEPKDGRPWRDYLNDGITAADAPVLVSLIQSEDFTDLEDDEDDAWWVPLHAWRALKQVMPAGVEALISTFNDLIEDEWALEEIPDVVAAAKDKAIPPLTAFLRSPSNDDLARMMACDCMGQLGKTHRSLRGKVIQSLLDCLKHTRTKDAEIGGALVSQLINLAATEAIEPIRIAFAEGRVDMNHCGDLEDVEIALGLRKKRITPRPRYYAGGMTPEEARERDAMDDDDYDDTPRMVPVTRTEPKIGRNDPCPCGSGKKYKKCCLV